MHFQYALFDLDGTLSESAPGITKSVQYALSSIGIYEPDLKKLETFVGPPLNIEFKRKYKVDDNTAEYLVEKYREMYNNGAIFDCAMYPGTEEMLADCRRAGIYLAVASSKPEPMVIKILKNFGIFDLFAVICGSGIEDEKRHAGVDQKSYIVQRALRGLMEIHPDAAIPEELFRRSCAMIGDRSFDMIGAKDNQVAAIGVTFGYGSEEELTASGADYIAHNMKELTEILTGQH